MGGVGSGSASGKDASNFKDGRTTYQRTVRGSKCSKCGTTVVRGGNGDNGRTVHHARRVERDGNGNAKEHNNSGRVMCRKCHGKLEADKRHGNT